MAVPLYSLVGSCLTLCGLSALGPATIAMDVELLAVANRTYRSYSSVDSPRTLSSDGRVPFTCSIQLAPNSPPLRRELLARIQLETDTLIRCERGEADRQNIGSLPQTSGKCRLMHICSD